MLKKSGIIFFLFLLLGTVYSQKVTLSGIIKDAPSGETLQGAYASLQDTATHTELRGTVSNTAGFVSLTVPEGTYFLRIFFLGYREHTQIIELKSDKKMNFDLEPAVITTDEVVVSAQKADKNVTAVDVGKMDLKVETIKSLPSLFGEADVLKSVQLLPGVQSGGEGNTGFYVRGGAADQNLILLDEATIYNAGHLFGFFSVFNADAVKNVEITKSGMPAYYGGRLASILDVSQKEGNMKKYEVDGGLGIIFSRLTVQGPIKKDRCSFLVSARRTYIDVLVQPFLPKTSPLKGTRFYFYDLNGKINVIINDKHRLYLGGYYGSDVYGFKSSSASTLAQMNWANGIASLRWNYIITPQLFLNTSALFSDYSFGTEIGMDVYDLRLKSGIRDYGLKSELTYLPDFPHTFKFGVHYIFHTVFPNSYEVEAGVATSLSMPQSPPYYAHDLSIYANDEFDACRWLRFNVGLRYTHFEHIGKFKRFLLDDFGNNVGAIEYKRGERVKQYNHVEPRISARFLLDSNTSIKVAYTLNYQYIHQVSLANVSLPTDVWMPCSDIIEPQQGQQTSIGLYRNFYKNMFETSIDFYYKDMQNLIEYKDGLDLTCLTMNPDQMYTFGKGWSYGMEIFLKKAHGKFTGFIGYTLSYTKRKFDDLNGGKPFYAKYDRRHDISINLAYEILRNKLNVSVVWVFATGNAMTIPVGYYFFAGNLMTEYSERNAFRVSPYHRLDLSVNWTIAKRKHFETSLNFSIYNVYNRQNAFFVFFETQTNITEDLSKFDMNTKAYQMSLFPIMPSITWNFKIL
ncbi:MAG: TonB-dependent receptor [Bacteroidales bacterium]|nr:TonB-dependent receptor [Bacteroidales bacterium]